MLSNNPKEGIRRVHNHVGAPKTRDLLLPATKAFMAERIITVTVWVAALTAGLCFEIPASRASYGDAPWCLVKSGGDNSYGDCQFKTFQECLQARTGIGFCNVSPSGPPAPVARAPRGRR
jgi:uncharacterized protein DUF3551